MRELQLTITTLATIEIPDNYTEQDIEDCLGEWVTQALIDNPPNDIEWEEVIR